MTFVKFRCLRSGNTVSFNDETAIAELRGHEGYAEIKETENEMPIPQNAVEAFAGKDAEAEVISTEPTARKRGRPAKMVQGVL